MNRVELTSTGMPKTSPSGLDLLGWATTGSTPVALDGAASEVGQGPGRGLRPPRPTGGMSATWIQERLGGKTQSTTRGRSRQ